MALEICSFLYDFYSFLRDCWLEDLGLLGLFLYGSGWKKLFAGGCDQFLEYFSSDGSSLIKHAQEVFDEGFYEWRHALVGQFIGEAPNFSAFQKIVDSLWGKNSLMKLYNVPLELYSKKGLSYIASAIEVPLYMVTITASKERLEFTKVCVEIAVDTKVLKSVSVQMRDNSVVTVSVNVPWMPPRCSKCKKFSHMTKYCSGGLQRRQKSRR